MIIATNPHPGTPPPDNVCPQRIPKVRTVHHVVGGDRHVKAARVRQHLLAQALALLLVIDVQPYTPHRRAPALELGHPAGIQHNRVYGMCAEDTREFKNAGR